MIIHCDRKFIDLSKYTDYKLYMMDELFMMNKNKTYFAMIRCEEDRFRLAKFSSESECEEFLHEVEKLLMLGFATEMDIVSLEVLFE